jgi:F-type H+-transporting ATPase subunit alpha
MSKNLKNSKQNDAISGKIISLADGVAWLTGLRNVMYGELIDFGHEIFGMALNLLEDKVGVIVLGNFDQLMLGLEAKTTGKLIQIGVNEEMIGRVVDPLGRPLDELGDFIKTTQMPLEKIAPGIVERKPVETPLQTGIKAIDSMIPIGRGQRELIIGDRQVGKTAIAIDTIINQKDSDVISIYVSIGQKRSKNAEVIKKLKEYGAFNKVIVVSASASDSAAMRYLAPYAGCAIGEYFLEKGKHALIIYDDLTKHAWAYREMSLLLKRPTGREAYPGDVFYLHSRLLERACQLSDENGGGSLTALPIIETQAQDVSAYIPTNVISITDGQIYLESDLFFAGIRPALNVGLSVSRIGGAAQIKTMKKIAGRLRLDLSQYYELATFAQFATDIDKATKEKIERGKRTVEILKQGQYSPFSLGSEILAIYLATSGSLDDIPIDLVREFEKNFFDYVHDKYKTLQTDVIKDAEFDDKLEQKLKRVISEYKNLFFKIYAIEKENSEED